MLFRSRDAETSLAPVSPEEALRMLARLRSQRLLDGFRGLPPVDRKTLAAIVSRISALVADHAGSIAEVDVNPLICRGERIVAVDGLVVTGAPDATATAAPR